MRNKKLDKIGLEQVWAKIKEKFIGKNTILTTKEQISANTSADNIAGALALKEAMAEYTNQFSQINSNMVYKAGDTIGNRNTLMWTVGTMTDANRTIYAFIPINKPIVGNVTFNLIEIVVRQNNQYLFSSSSIEEINTNITYYVIVLSNSGLYLSLQKNDGWGGVNNDVVGLAIKFTATIS